MLYPAFKHKLHIPKNTIFYFMKQADDSSSQGEDGLVSGNGSDHEPVACGLKEVFLLIAVFFCLFYCCWQRQETDTSPQHLNVLVYVYIKGACSRQ
mgnify:CR=1 FL=1